MSMQRFAGAVAISLSSGWFTLGKAEELRLESQLRSRTMAELHVEPLGNTDSEAIFNSCAANGTSAGQPICSGHGECTERLVGSGMQETTSFCACTRDWADPECRTRRLSQTTAFKLSLFGGILGLDSFYVGQHVAGVAKLVTLGGMGVWWALDVVRIGSRPIKTAQYRLAADLEPWVFVFSSTCMAAFVGLVVFLVLEWHLRRKRSTGALMIAADEVLKALPNPAVGYGTLKPSDPSIPAEAAVPAELATKPMVPVGQVAKALRDKAQDTQAPKTSAKTLNCGSSVPKLSDQGLKAPLSEMGYGTVAALKNHEQMKIYIKRVVDVVGGRIEDEDGEEFSKFVSEYSGVIFVRSFRRMMDSLRCAPWIIYEKPEKVAPIATEGNLAFFLPCVGGEGAVLMNEDGRPAVANIDLILRRLTEEAPSASVSPVDEEQEEEKPAQVKSPAPSFKVDDAAQRLGLVLPPFELDEPPLLDHAQDDCPTPGRVKELAELLEQNKGAPQPAVPAPAL